MFDIGVIGAMDIEVKALTEMLSERETKKIGSIEFNTGTIFGKKVVIAKCGIGKVFAAIATEAMIVGFASPWISGSMSTYGIGFDLIVGASYVLYFDIAFFVYSIITLFIRSKKILKLFI